MAGKFSNKVDRRRRSIPVSTRTRARVLQMLDVKSTDTIPDGSTLVWSASLETFELMPYGGTYGSKYDSTQTFTVDSGTTNYDVKVNQTALWSSVAKARYARIITSGADVTLRFNATTNDGYPMKVSESPFEIALTDITNIYITTSTSPADVRILLIGE